MPDNKEKETPLFSDDLPKEPEDKQEPESERELATSDPATPPQDVPADSDEPPATSTEPPTVEEPLLPPKDIFEAVNRRDLDAVVRFLEKKSNLAATNEEEKTALQTAAEIGAYDIVRFLVECGANIEAKGKDGRTPLMLALSNSHFETAEYLLSKGASANVASASNYTPLMQAAAKGATDIVHDILPKIDNVNAKNNEGRTALMIAIRFGHRDIIDTLLARNASLQIIDIHGNTAISLAEDAELKKYLSQKAEEETLRITDGQKSREEKQKESKRIPLPHILVLASLFLLFALFGSFSYLYYKNNIKVVPVTVSPSMKRSAEIIAASFCVKVKECRNDSSASFLPLCAQQAGTVFTRYLNPKKVSTCIEAKATQCGQCLASLTCDQLNKFNDELVGKNCRVCEKVCAE